MAYDLRRLFRKLEDEFHVQPYRRLTTLSGQIGIDRYTIEKAIRLSTGTSFRLYQKSLMTNDIVLTVEQEPHLSIKELSHKLGFASERSFRRFVKSAFGVSPTTLRQATIQVKSPQSPAYN
jgi:AraC-like DNA-binding protein